MSRLVALRLGPPLGGKPRHHPQQPLPPATPLLQGDPPKPLGIVHLKDPLLPRRPLAGPRRPRRHRPQNPRPPPPTPPLEQLLTDLRRRRRKPHGPRPGRRRQPRRPRHDGGTSSSNSSAPSRTSSNAKPPSASATCSPKSRVPHETRRHPRHGRHRRDHPTHPAAELPAPAATIIEAVQARERSLSTFLGTNSPSPTARLPGLDHAIVFAARSHQGVRFGEEAPQKANFLFLLLTPTQSPPHPDQAPRPHRRPPRKAPTSGNASSAPPPPPICSKPSAGGDEMLTQ
jgi:hypothetical protein